MFNIPTMEDTRCASCGEINSRKNGIRCTDCTQFSHLTCVKLSQAQARVLGRRACRRCRIRQGARDEIIDLDPPLPIDFDLTNYINRCRSSYKVLAIVPKGAIIAVAEALDTLLKQAMERSGKHWLHGAGYCPLATGVCGVLIVSLPKSCTDR
jgi:hypothetical protein